MKSNKDDKWLFETLGELEFKKAVLNPFPEKKMVYIVAEKQFQARDYARRKGELTKDEWRFVDNADRLRGVKDVKIVALAGWNRTLDAREIAEIIDYLLFHKRAEVEYVQEW